MDEPMNFAIVENGVVVNTIWLSASNRADFPNAVCVANRAVFIGDLYADGAFIRDGEPVLEYPAYVNTLEQRVAELEEALAMVEEALNA